MNQIFYLMQVLSNLNSGSPYKNAQDTRKKVPTTVLTVSQSQHKFVKDDHASPNAAAPRGSQIGKVHRFLTACNPSMEWCLYLFVESGWLSEDQLRAVASWSHTRRRTLLKKILAGPNGQRVVTEIDIASLEKQFRNYFTM